MSKKHNDSKSTLDLDAENPWPGLIAYTEEANRYFHGRDEETTEIRRLVKRETLTVLFGQSGLGKTSLLNAGLFPRLRVENYLPVYMRLDYSKDSPDFISQIKAAIAQSIVEQGIKAPLPGSAQSLWEYFHLKETDFWNPRNRLLTVLLVFDQFEEIFTLGKANERCSCQARELISELADLIEDRPSEALSERIEKDPDLLNTLSYEKQNYKVIFSLREDFLPAFGELRTNIRSVMLNHFRLTRMNGVQALHAVLEPGGELVDEKVALQIVHFVARKGVDSSSQAFDQERLMEIEVDPALLSVVCRELNTRRIQQQQSRITIDLLKGNGSEILKDFYERSVSDLPANVSIFIEDHLLTRSGHRDSVALEEMLDAGISGEDVETLVNRRLLRLEERFGSQRVELTHDVLIDVLQASRDRRRNDELQEEERRKAIELQEEERRKAIELQEEERRKAIELQKKFRLSLVAAGVFAVLLFVAIAAMLMANRAESRTKAALRQADSTLAEYYAEKGHKARSELQWGTALLQYRKSLGYEDTLAARIGANDALEHFVPEVAHLEEKGEIYSAAFSNDGKLFVYATSDKHIIHIWDAVNWRELTTLEGHKGQITSLHFHPSGSLLASSSDDKTFCLWDTATWTVIGKGTHTKGITSIAFSRNGQFLVSGSKDNTVRLWNSKTCAMIREYKGHTDWIRSVSFSPDSQTFASASDDHSVRIWSTDNGKELSVLKDHSAYVMTVSYSPSGKQLSSTSSSGYLIVWDVDTGKKTVDAKVEYNTSGKILVAHYLPDGHFLLVWGQHLSIYDTKASGNQWKLTTDLKIFTESFRCLAASPDGNLFATAVGGGVLRLWSRIHALNPLEECKVHETPVTSLCLSSDGRYAVSGSKNGSVRVWDTETGEDRSVTYAFPKDASLLTIDPSGRWIASVLSDNSIYLYDTVEQQGIQLDNEKGGHVNAVAVNQEGSLIAAGLDNGIILLWNTDRERKDCSVIRTGRKADVLSLAFSADGRLLASGFQDRTICVWDIQNKANGLVTTLRGHGGPVDCLAFSHDGSTIASASQEVISALDGGPATSSGAYEVRVWDVVTRISKILRGHESRVTCLNFSPDDKLLASASEDGNVDLWNVAAQKQLVQLQSGSSKFVIAFQRKTPHLVKMLYTVGEKNVGCRRIDFSESPSLLGEMIKRIELGWPWELDSNDQPVLKQAPWLSARERLNAGQSQGLSWAPDGGRPFVALYERDLQRSMARHDAGILFEAIRSGDTTKIGNIIEKGINADVRFIDGSTPLTMSTEMGSTSIIRMLLEKGADVNSTNKEGETSLEIAVNRDQREIIGLLAGNGSDLNRALNRAIDRMDEQAVTVLIDSGADLEKKDDDSATVLMRAAKSGNGSIVRMLLDHGANIKTRDNEGCTPLIYAVRSGQFAVATVLLDSGAEIEAKAKDKKTPMMYAATGSRPEVTQLLLDRRAEIEAKDAYGQTPLMHAAVSGSLEVVRVLLDSGADLHARSVFKVTPLLYAAANGHRETAELLLDRGADLDDADKFGAMASHLAADNGDLDTVKLLIDKGAAVDKGNKMGWTPLMVAVSKGHRHVVEFLLEKGASLESTDRIGRNCLMIAAANGKREIVEWLIQKGVGIETRDQDGYTAFLWAAAEGHLQVLDLLKEAGANIDAESHLGETAKVLMSEKGHWSILDQLSAEQLNVLETASRADTCGTKDLEPHLFRMLVCYGDAQKHAKRNEKAKQAYTKALECAKKMFREDSSAGGKQLAIVQTRLAMLMYEMENYQKSVEHIQEDIEVKLDLVRKGIISQFLVFISYGKLAWHQALTGQGEEAIRSANEAIRLNPSCTECFMNLAHGYLLNGQFDKALEIHQNYLGANFSTGRSWSDVVREDFALLRKAGITKHDEEMKKIESILQ